MVDGRPYIWLKAYLTCGQAKILHMTEDIVYIWLMADLPDGRKLPVEEKKSLPPRLARAFESRMP